MPLMPLANAVEVLNVHSSSYTVACRYADAVDALSSPHAGASPADIQAMQTLIDNAQVRLQEQQHGKFDFAAMHRLAAPKAAAVASSGLEGAIHAASVTRLRDYADYVSPTLRVAVLPGRGRGLLATRALQPGELLMAVHADDIVGADEVRCENGYIAWEYC